MGPDAAETLILLRSCCFFYYMGIKMYRHIYTNYWRSYMFGMTVVGYVSALPGHICRRTSRTFEAAARLEKLRPGCGRWFWDLKGWFAIAHQYIFHRFHLVFVHYPTYGGIIDT